MPIAACAFYKEDTLFTAGTDNLKAWHLDEEVYMSDNIETSSKGILHMVVKDKIQQLAYTSGTLSVFECFLSEVNFKSPYNFISPSNNSIDCDSPVLRDIKSRGRNEKNNSFNISQVKRANSINPTNALTNEKSKKVI